MTIHKHPALPSETSFVGPDADVVIIGAGTGGLRTAYALRRRGIRVCILDRASTVAMPWRGRHPQLCLNPHRTLSHLAGLPFPRSAGAFPARDTVIRYMEDYARFVGVPIKHGVEVRRVDQTAGGGGRLDSSEGCIDTAHVVVATGGESTSFVPDWPGCGGFAGVIRHSADFGDLGQYRDKRVLVVGAGNSGTDVLNHLGSIADYTSKTPHEFVATGIARDSRIKTDGLASYNNAPNMEHDKNVVGDRKAHPVLPWIHRVFSRSKAWAIGVCHGLRARHLQSFPDEFVFRFNGRSHRHAGPETLPDPVAKRPPMTCRMLIGAE